MKNINQKLLEIQEEIGAIKKTSKNPYFNSNYFDINALLEAVKPVLNKHKVLLLQPLHENSLQTILVDTESDEKIESSAVLPQNPDAQKMGAIITYYRRYMLTSLLALEAEDNDANDTGIDKVAEVTKMFNKDAPFNDTPGDVPMKYECPVCKKDMVEKTGRYGKFYSCSDYPTCKGTRNSYGKDATK